MSERPYKFDLLPEAEPTFRKFAAFGREHLKSEDIDPVYPVLKWIQRDLSLEEAMWSTFLYVAWYNLPSGLEVFSHWPTPDRGILEWLETVRYPTGVERRNLRGGRVYAHIKSYLDTMEDYSTQYAFWFKDVPHRRPKTLEERQDNWRQVNENIRELFGNGRWAAYKMCEVFVRVNGLSIIEAPDMGNAHSSGPRHGLARFYGEVEGEHSDAIQLLDAMGEDLQYRVSRAIGEHVDIEHLETMLCDWNSVAKGKYYVGHDIDQMLEQAVRAKEDGKLSEKNYRLILAARKETLPHEYLGELGSPPWYTVDPDRKKHYVNRDKIIVRGKR